MKKVIKKNIIMNKSSNYISSSDSAKKTSFSELNINLNSKNIYKHKLWEEKKIIVIIK